jgi:hypothetical protein
MHSKQDVPWCSGLHRVRAWAEDPNIQARSSNPDLTARAQSLGASVWCLVFGVFPPLDFHPGESIAPTALMRISLQALRLTNAHDL